MNRTLKLLAAVVPALAVALGAVALATPAQALSYDPDRFDRGSIISDALFYDDSAMTVSQIQSFLDSKVSTCSTSSQEDCLKDYRTGVTERAADSYCKAIPGRTGASAAQVIYDVQKACGISAKVLLVTLQKEQGLVTSTSPSSRRYEIAMGYGCPDGAPCIEEYYGFANQVYRAARQFVRYATLETSYRYRAGGTYQILMAPFCSDTITVTIANKATAGLYNYTPYTPNDQSLASYPGGTSYCGSYGNRNFYAFYSAWFGDPNVSTPVVKYAGYSHWWLLSDDDSYRIHGADPELKVEARTLGTEATVARSYIESYSERGLFRGVFRDTAGTYFVVDGGRRLALGDCAAADASGFGCATVPTLSAAQRDAFADGGELGDYVQDTSGRRWLLEGGERHEVLSDAALAAADVTPASLVTLQRSTTLDTVPIGAPVVEPGTLVQSDVAGADWYYVDAGRVYVVPKTLRLETDIRLWMGGSQGNLTYESLQAWAEPEPLPLAMRNGAATAYFVMTADGIARVEDPEAWPYEFGVIGFGTMSVLARADDASMPTFVTRAGADRADSWISGDVLSWLEDGTRRPIWTQNHEELQSRGRGVDSHVTLVSALFDAVPKGNLLVPSGAVIRAQGFTAKLLVDGDTRRQLFTSTYVETTARPILDVPMRVVQRLTPAAEPATLGMRCGDELYLQVSKKLRPISEADAARYAPAFAFNDYDPTTCRALDHDPRAVGSLLVSGSDFWQVDQGVRHRISRTEYEQLRTTLGSAVGVSSNFLSLIPAAG